MKLLFTICGRAGSKGIKNKNIKNFLDKPLPLYTLSAIDIFLSNNPEIEYDIAVNTDSTELINIFKDSKLRKVEFVERKQDLAGDSVSKLAVIRDTFNEMKKNENEYDAVIDLDITSPLRRKYDLQRVYEKLCENDKYDVIFTVTESRRNPYFNMVFEKENGTFSKVIDSNFTARQQAPMVYDMNASIYAYTVPFIENNENIFDGRCGIVKMNDTGVLDLDHENDFEMMEVIAEYIFKNYSEYRDIYSNIR